MKKWGVELESQNEQTRGAHTQRTGMVTQRLSIKEAVEERREKGSASEEAVLIDYRSLMATSPVEAGAETRM
jgi:hypothetical protein